MASICCQAEMLDEAQCVTCGADGREPDSCIKCGGEISSKSIGDEIYDYCADCNSINI